jgi:Uma2 family endonuclease
MSAQPQPRLTPEEYLELDRASQVRSEYYDGRMYAMAGGTHDHGIIVFETAHQIANAIEGRPCLVTVENVRVQVAPDGLYTYPDVVVVCGKTRYRDGHSDTILNPILLIEVLSPSTEAYDRGFKAAQYRTIESLQEYAFVSQSEPRVEIYRRGSANEWVLTEFIGLEASALFRSVECAIPLAKIYDKATFGGEEPAPPPPSPPQ